MIKYKDVQKIEQEIISIKCDVCGKVYESGDIEIQEFHHINFCGEYGSIFGDGTQVNCDICQYCLHKIIGNFCRCRDGTT